MLFSAAPCLSISRASVLRAGIRKRVEFLRRRPRKPGVVNGDIFLHVVQLYRRTARRPGNRDSEWQLHALDVAVIRIINLLRIDAQRGVFVAHHSLQEARLLVEIELGRWPAFSRTQQDVALALADLLRVFDTQLWIILLDVQRELQVRGKLRAFKIRSI